MFKVGVTTLRIQKVESVPEAGHTVLGWQVGNVRDSAKALSANGVRFEKFSELAQDELGIWASPSGALVAWFRDPDGNTLSLTELDA